MFAEIKIDFQCQVNRSRYKVIDGKDNKRWIVANNAKAPMIPSCKQFDAETLALFMEISKNHRIAEHLALHFVNRYGMLAPASNYRVQDISGWSTYLRVKDRERSSGEPVEKWSPIDFNKLLGFKIWEGGKVLPTYSPNDLGTALYIAWFFGWQKPELKKCEYFAKYGERKGCQRFYTSKRSDSKFCSKNCRNSYGQKEERNKK